jgi:hypothetical protein
MIQRYVVCFFMVLWVVLGAVPVLLAKKNPEKNLPPIVFVSRKPLKNKGDAAGTVIEGIGQRGRTAKTGGKLLVRRADGTLTHLAKKFFDVQDVAVSYDAKKILFSAVRSRNDAWRIYEINADGSGLRQLTASHRDITRETDVKRFGDAAPYLEGYDDIDPCYLPDGRIVFASTRYPALAPFEKIRATNLYTMNADGTTLRRITTEKNGGEEPCIDPNTGRIVFARWWLNIDMPTNRTPNGLTRDSALALTPDVANLWHAITVKPDGDEMKLYAGFPRTREGLQAYKPFVMQNGDLLATFTSRLSMLDGVGDMTIRRFKKGASVPVLLSPMNNAQATDASELNAAQILFSRREIGNGKDFALAVVDTNGNHLETILDLNGTDELDAHVLLPRPVPPVLKDDFEQPIADYPPQESPTEYYLTKNLAFRFDCLNIYMNGKVDEPMPDAPVISRGGTIRFYMNVQRQNPNGRDSAILVKTSEVDYQGAVHEADVPAEVPLFEQVVDLNGELMKTTSGKLSHVSGLNSERLGGGTKCVGCHVGHTLIDVGYNAYVAGWFNAATSAKISASSVFEENGNRHEARRAIDRQVQLGADTAQWISNESQNAALTLGWSQPILLSAVKLYGIPPNEKKGTNTSVKASEILLFSKSKNVRSISLSETIMPQGTVVELPTPLKVDSLRIVLKQVTGTIHHQPLSGLAEIETTARLVHHLDE